MSRAPWRRLPVLAALGLMLTACAAPVSAVRVDSKVVMRETGRSAVTTGEPSGPTRNVLFEHGLFEAFRDRPEAAIATLHRAMVASQGDQGLLFALAELSFVHAQAAAKRDYYLASVVYAYAFLFPEDTGAAPPGRFDPRLRSAADLYNRALTLGLTVNEGAEVVPRGGEFPLPFGTMEIAFDPAELRTGDRELYGFVPTAELDVHGLAMRYRWAGLGAPLAASARAVDGSKPRDMVAPRLRVPVTAVLRIAGARRTLVQGEKLVAQLALHRTWDAEMVSIAGEQVPLEREPSAAIALTFTGMPIMEIETFSFLGRLGGQMADRPPLVSTTPYKPGLVPVVFVHGTQSSIVRWAEMYNRLLNDSDIRSRYQFWFFQYDSGNPIALSALRLREALTAAVARLDPDGRDPALRRMVLIGHSQGGLLVKMQVISSGDRLWDAASDKRLDELTLSASTRDLLQRAAFVEPLPEVARAVFICTPHRGSFVAARNVLANLFRRFRVLPSILTDLGTDLARNPGALRSGIVIPSAVDNMSPRHQFIKALQDIPVAPSVAAHSIIAVNGEGPVEKGDDGVVAYSSAHIEPVESELVVRSSHSTQGHPATIEEVRRILRLRTDEVTGRRHGQ